MDNVQFVTCVVAVAQGFARAKEGIPAKPCARAELARADFFARKDQPYLVLEHVAGCNR